MLLITAQQKAAEQLETEQRDSELVALRDYIAHTSVFETFNMNIQQRNIRDAPGEECFLCFHLFTSKVSSVESVCCRSMVQIYSNSTSDTVMDLLPSVDGAVDRGWSIEMDSFLTEMLKFEMVEQPDLTRAFSKKCVICNKGIFSDWSLWSHCLTQSTLPVDRDSDMLNYFF